jgi:hypothetical protein
MIDSIFVWLISFAGVSSIFVPYFFGAGNYSFAVIALPTGEAAWLVWFANFWNGFISILALLSFQIPGVELLSALYVALTIWTIVRLVRG